MPTHEELVRFLREWKRLTPEQQTLFMAAVQEMVEDLSESGRFRRSLRIKGVQGSANVFELSWSGDGRATFQYGPQKLPGEPHIIWRRVGGHEILDDP